MPGFVLKDYQKRALEALERFLDGARQDLSPAGFDRAFASVVGVDHAYRSYGFEDAPYVCLRIPTGGGKTLLGAHVIQRAVQAFLPSDHPLVIWLTPSNVILDQTLEALRKPGHPYYEALAEHFGDAFAVIGIDGVNTIRAQDVGHKVLIVVATMATLRVDDTSNRNIYSYHEDFEPHFARLPAWAETLDLERVSEADLTRHPYLMPEDLGKVKRSFANLLHVFRPLVIVDEAHNARTPLTFKTLQRIRPAAIVELTATPNISPTNGSNVLYSVSAQELKSDEMVKLPIMLYEHTGGWEEAVRDAILTRKRLADYAAGEPEYLRPIVLFQAEDKGGVVTVDVLKGHLMEQEKLPEAEIAVATGKQRELDGIDLFAPACKVKYIITVDALREGWDCSFAYVLCSVRNVRSATSVEQLLGRVLRMPYARKRGHEELNRAYAHVVAREFFEAANALTDRLVAMGFDKLDSLASVMSGWQYPLLGEGDEGSGTKAAGDGVPPLTLTVETHPNLDALSDDERQEVSVAENDAGFVVTVKGEAGAAVEDMLLSAVAGKRQADVVEQLRNYRILRCAALAPAAPWQGFAPIPRLMLREQGELTLLEPESLLDLAGWSLKEASAALEGFDLRDNTNLVSVDVGADGRVQPGQIESYQLDLDGVETMLAEADLVRWLNPMVRDIHIGQPEMAGYLARVIKWLEQERGFSLTALGRRRLELARAIKDRIASLKKDAAKRGFQQVLSGLALPEVSFNEQFEFQQGCYPVTRPYSGRWHLPKHLYEQIEDLKDSGEEFECARAVAYLPAVKRWVRNPVHDRFGFWLTIPGGRFYPDFVAELNDGREMLVEYKGDVYKTNDDSVVKRQVGNLWADKCGGKGIFLFVEKRDKDGRGIQDQLLDATKGAGPSVSLLP